MDEQIDVWEVSPHINTDFDTALFDDHVRAIEYTNTLVESIFDDLSNGEEVQITIKLTTMARGDFEEVREHG